MFAERAKEKKWRPMRRRRRLDQRVVADATHDLGFGALVQNHGIGSADASLSRVATEESVDEATMSAGDGCPSGNDLCV
jgi:hypothetical protein